MRLETLAIHNFRNIEAAEVEWSPSLTVLVGKNGQGKTNVLEAAALALSRQTLRAKSERELARFGTDGYRLSAGLADSAGLQATATRTVWLHPPRRQIVGPQLPVVTFSPDDLAVVKGSPDGRREFMDRLLSQLFPRYHRQLSRYQRAVAQRNRALKENAADAVLAGFEPLLAEAGAYCWEQRQWLVARLGPLAASVYGRLAPGEVPTLQLAPGGSEAVSDRAGLERLLEIARPKDRIRGATSAGPHRDEVRLAVTGVEARLLSQGQQRTLVLALQLAARALLERELGQRPLLVLDDVFSELDGPRRQALLEVVTVGGQQTLVADVDARAFLPLATRRYRLDAGRVREEAVGGP